MFPHRKCNSYFLFIIRPLKPEKKSYWTKLSLATWIEILHLNSNFGQVNLHRLDYTAIASEAWSTQSESQPPCSIVLAYWWSMVCPLRRIDNNSEFFSKFSAIRIYLWLCQTVKLFLCIEFKMKFSVQIKSFFNVPCLFIPHIWPVNNNNIFDAKNFYKRQQLLVIIAIAHES